MKKYTYISLLVLVLFLVSSCATIVKGRSQEVSIDSSPTGANVVIFDAEDTEVWNSRTPTTVELDRGDGFFSAASYQVEISLDGYESTSVQIEGSVNGWYIAGNLFFSGILGWLIVDPLTGAMYNLRPEEITEDLAATVGIEYNDDALSLAVVLLPDVPVVARESMELITEPRAN